MRLSPILIMGSAESQQNHFTNTSPGRWQSLSARSFGRENQENARPRLAKRRPKAPSRFALGVEGFGARPYTPRFPAGSTLAEPSYQEDFDLLQEGLAELVGLTGLAELGRRFVERERYSKPPGLSS